jgi:hypothetical protein
MNKVEIRNKIREIEEKILNGKAKLKVHTYRIRGSSEEILEKIDELKLLIAGFRKEIKANTAEQLKLEKDFEIEIAKLLEEKNMLIKTAVDLFMKEEESKNNE